MSKITNDGLTRSGTGCFIAVSIMATVGVKGLTRFFFFFFVHFLHHLLIKRRLSVSMDAVVYSRRTATRWDNAVVVWWVWCDWRLSAAATHVVALQSPRTRSDALCHSHAARHSTLRPTTLRRLRYRVRFPAQTSWQDTHQQIVNEKIQCIVSESKLQSVVSGRKLLQGRYNVSIDCSSVLVTINRS